MEWGPRRPATILITNDDGPPGPHSPFISAFVEMLCNQLPDSHIVVYLPSQQQSWVSKKIDRFGTVRLLTLRAAPDSYPEKRLETINNARWTIVEGSPATSVLLALTKLHPVQPDLIISGPNIGQNCGSSYILSSGTVAGALEGALQGIRSISLSVSYRELPTDWTPYSSLISSLCLTLGNVVAKLWRSWPDGLTGLLYNVNIGLDSRPDAQIRLCSALNETYGLLFAKTNSTESDDGSESYQFEKCCFMKEPAIGSDRRAINDGFISVTPFLPRLLEPILPKMSIDAILTP